MKVLESIQQWFIAFMYKLFGKPTGAVVLEEVVEELKKPTLKKYDTTKFTRQDHDVIMQEYKIYRDCKAALGSKFTKTLVDVTNNLNNKLQLNKSKSTYSTVWTGKVSRESLEDRVSV